MSLELWDDAAAMHRRLRLLGLVNVGRVVLHENRTVMISMARGRVLRMHRGYVYASDRVLAAIVRFLDSRTGKLESRRAERELLAFPARDFVPSGDGRRRRETQRPEDARLLEELRRRHGRLNRQHFDGRLKAIPIRLSGRMRTRLGELLLDDRGRRATEIAISRRHLRRDGWTEVEHTLLHEMVHQWQAETGQRVDHGPGFRQKAVEVGVEPRAWRFMQSRRKAARY
jgi:hypothetical protein